MGGGGGGGAIILEGRHILERALPPPPPPRSPYLPRHTGSGTLGLAINYASMHAMYNLIIFLIHRKRMIL